MLAVQSRSQRHQTGHPTVADRPTELSRYCLPSTQAGAGSGGGLRVPPGPPAGQSGATQVSAGGAPQPGTGGQQQPSPQPAGYTVSPAFPPQRDMALIQWAAGRALPPALDGQVKAAQERLNRLQQDGT